MKSDVRHPLRDGDFFVKTVEPEALDPEHMEPLHYASPEELANIPPDVESAHLSDFFSVGTHTIDPSAYPSRVFSEVNLDRVDKFTGEITKAVPRFGRDFTPGNQKVVFSEGDILYGKMRPYLNNVAIAQRTVDNDSGDFVGSLEWERLIPKKPAIGYLLLFLLRSEFTLRQMSVTKGQTRPRAHMARLKNVLVPSIPTDLEEGLSTTLGRIFETRARFKRILYRLESAYHAYGRGRMGIDEFREQVKEAETALG